ncbi:MULTISPECIES: curli production assembly/transport component CsgF [unclassified Kaistella]|uniref:curli production assembly/transport component CsgF n=1 Tax=unclassified Kaistella TaxID=2762626 RepID=UPI0027330165|nr:MULTISPECIES: curli production assembly/transport component CsgF [unclassified Kaistella]MCZ2085540.1 curli assembly protein CsgF [Flavobacteriales bacterium]MDP2453898.1 curli assembly protein CsgF [Kaistella sp. SH11-4b]MDP2456955.1 curli assembly protein CsgF [Kaistella sp. SH40-3]MDP2459712.1 curli assembly protein CsgF [Kaistella sp. SH19-2b]
MKTLILYLILGMSFIGAQQFVYKPINPAFGGDTFNYQWLLSSAASQNQFKGDTSLYDSLSSLDSFTESLNRQLLSQLSQKLFGDQFGDGNLKPGNYTFGSMYVQVTQSDKGLIVRILNTSTGEQSEIIIPN